LYIYFIVYARLLLGCLFLPSVSSLLFSLFKDMFMLDWFH